MFLALRKNTVGSKSFSLILSQKMNLLGIGNVMLLIFFKIGPFTVSILLFLSFQCTRNFANGWIWTVDLWWTKRALYQLIHSYCPEVIIHRHSLAKCTFIVQWIRLQLPSCGRVRIPCTFMLFQFIFELCLERTKIKRKRGRDLPYLPIVIIELGMGELYNPQRCHLRRGHR